MDYDVIVAGLGAMGSASVYQLARSGVSTLGLDQFRPPHDQGSSHGDSRITRLAIGEGEHLTPLVQHSHELWRRLEQESAETLLTQCGALMISSDTTRASVHVGNFFTTTLSAARRHGIDHSILDAAEIRRRFPQFLVRDHEYGYFEPQAGFVRPEACIRAQLLLAERLGAHIRTQERLLSFEAEGAAVRVITDKASYRTRRLVLAAGAWMPDLLGPSFASLFRITRQVLNWFAIAENPDLFTPGRCPVFIWQLPEGTRNLYGFPAIDGPEGGVKIASEQDTTTTTAGSVRRDVSRQETEVFYRDYVAPNLRYLSPQSLKARSCLYTQTADFGFIVDTHPASAQVLIVSACSGHGFKHSAALGEGIARWARGEGLPPGFGTFLLNRF
ncbi:MAG: N-methyl-L-tryptophan oxidase [Alphaproteobacteria bacterium]|nr:N-methyl-L-tryptophan oxidase [Alphaproteobacteria bacterium]